MLFEIELPVAEHYLLGFDFSLDHLIGREIVKSDLRPIVVSGNKMTLSRSDYKLHVKRRPRISLPVEVDTSLSGGDNSVVPDDLTIKLANLRNLERAAFDCLGHRWPGDSNHSLHR